MGNNTSQSNENESIKKSLQDDKNLKLSYILEHITEHYILNQTFQDMLKLNDPTYCEKIIILSSNVISENLNTHEIEYLAQKTKNGVDVFEKEKQLLTFASKEQINNINKTMSPLKKKRLCLGISRFFVKVAQLYSAILMTLNPSYTYTDMYGKEFTVPLHNKNTIPPGVQVKKVYMNLCNKRIDRLTNKSVIPSTKQSSSEESTIAIHPEYCSVGLDSYGNIDALNNEIGMKELEQLYYDVYDYDANKFNKMSEEMKKQYDIDLRMLYTAFTGEEPEKMPPSITKFSDIKLKTYSKNPSCLRRDNPYNIKHYGSLNDSLFLSYVEHIKAMRSSIETKQQELVSILREMFISIIDNETGKHTYSLHPELNIEKLNSLNKKAIKSIVEQYVNCEKDYLKGLQIYESIVESKIKKLTQDQIQKLENEVRKSIDTLEFK